MSKPQSTSIGPKALKDLLKDVRAYEHDMQSSRGDMGQMIATAVEQKGLDRKVFGLIRKLDKLSPEKLAAWKETFEDYFVKAGLLSRAESAPRLALDKSENEADEEVQEEAAGDGDGKVTPINGGRRGRRKKGAAEDTAEGSSGLPH